MKMRLNRMERLLRKMRGVHQNHLHMGHWLNVHVLYAVWKLVVKNKDPNGRNIRFQVNEALLNDCGMQACLAGHAGSIPEFQKAGLHYIANAWSDRILNLEMAYGGQVGIAALEKFFGLTVFQAKRLFMPDQYEKPNHETEQIQVSQVIIRLSSMIAAEKTERKLADSLSGMRSKIKGVTVRRG